VLFRRSLNEPTYQFCFAYPIGDLSHAQLRKRGILISMSGRGNCSDNSMVLRRENSPPDCFLILLTFFKTIKSELIWPVAWQSRQQAENAVARYIEGFYNPVRRHSSLGFKSPIAFERQAREVS
jgi:putative transposase